MRIITFAPHHLDDMDIQPAQRMTAESLKEAKGAEFGRAWTAIVDGRPVACAGLITIWPGRAYAWAVLSAQAGRWMYAITRAIRERLQSDPHERIEMAVDADFAAGQRWAMMLGFECETPAPLRKYIQGRDAYLYARIK